MQEFYDKKCHNLTQKIIESNLNDKIPNRTRIRVIFNFSYLLAIIL